MSVIHIMLKDGRRVIYAEPDIRILLEQGRFTPDLLYWRIGMEEWKPLRELPLPEPAPVAPVPPVSVTPTPAKTKIQSPVSSLPPLTTVENPRDRLLPVLRFVACAIDFALIFAPVALAYSLTPKAVPHHFDRSVHWTPLTVLKVYEFILWFIQIVFSFAGTSLGKKVFRLLAVSEAIDEFDLRMLLRLPTHGFCGVVPLVYYLDPALLHAAIIYAVLDAALIWYDGKCIHDYIAKTFVVRSWR
jgi:uncharacterized RDD family membrane protein YckC